MDYKAGDTRRALRAACPDGIDVYFDNVGGDILEACLFNMKNHGRIACCGAVSQYDGGRAAWPARRPRADRHQAADPARLPGDGLLSRSAREALADLKAWVQSGQLKVREDIIDGFENLPAALIGLLAGENVGKRMVKVI